MDILRSKLLIIAFIFAVFFLRGVIFLDPDFGWHLRAGQLILEKGIPSTDPFSYTMPSYPFIDHEWLTNIIIALFYQVSGIIGLSALASLLVLFTIGISLKNHWHKWSLVPLLLTSTALLPFSGIRPQVITWLFLSLLISMLFNNKRWTTWRFVVPVLFLLWANLHGGFAAGLAILLFGIMFKSIEQKKVRASNVFLWFISLSATLINPYGASLWQRVLGELWLQATDPSLRYEILEWLPGVFYLELALWILVVLSFFLIYRYRRLLSLTQKGLVMGIFTAGLISTRHLPLWLVANLPLLNEAILHFRRESASYKYGKVRFEKAYKILLVVTILVCAASSLWILREALSLSEERFYPKQAVEFLKIHPTSGQVFSHYNWGGYLIWKYPEKKVFIDGRMPSWKQEKKLPKESSFAFQEYNNVLHGKTPLASVMAKYQVNTILFPIQFIEVGKHNCFETLHTLKECIVAGKKRAGEAKFLQQIKKAHMKMIYHDPIAVIYRMEK